MAVIPVFLRLFGLVPQRLIVLTFDDIRLTAVRDLEPVITYLDCLRYQTMGISDQKIEHGESLRSENNLFRAVQEGSARRIEEEGIK